MSENTNPKYIIKVATKGEELGTITVETLPEIAPKHSANFEDLVTSGAYNGTAFHRVIPGFMIQGGDPNSKDKARDTWGYGDPNQKKVPAEFNSTSHKRGIISAARSQDPNSASSQFFICVADATFLDGQYTVFGRVTEGMDIADKIVDAPRDRSDNPYDKIEMTIEKL
ncbi:MAG: peptidylprolyl isomerase [Candidatus Kapabacteria bacterium]|nr:peptidylprolyl isomerase [Candidatus Kapabacteria bacterium]